MEAILLILFILVSVGIIDTVTYKSFNDVFKRKG
jgi:hypothetical protein